MDDSRDTLILIKYISDSQSFELNWIFPSVKQTLQNKMFDSYVSITCQKPNKYADVSFHFRANASLLSIRTVYDAMTAWRYGRYPRWKQSHK